MSALEDLASAIRTLATASSAATAPDTGLDSLLSRVQAELQGIPEADSAASAISAAQSAWRRVSDQGAAAARISMDYANSLA